MTVLTWDRIFSGGGFSGYGAASCPPPSVYEKGRGCCLAPSFRPAGKGKQCCPVSSTHVVNQPNGKYSLNCKGGSGGGGGGGNGGGGGTGGGQCTGKCVGFSHTQPFTISAVSGNTIMSDRNLCACPDGCAEVRRKASGLAEFLGDASVNGNQITLDPGSLGSHWVPPKTGESVYLLYKPCGSSSSSAGSSITSGISDLVSGTTGGIPTWVWLAGGGVVLYLIFSKSGSSGGGK